MPTYFPSLISKHSPHVFHPAITLDTVPHDVAHLHVAVALNTFPPLPSPLLLGKVLLSFSTLKCHCFYENFANTPLPYLHSPHSTTRSHWLIPELLPSSFRSSLSCWHLLGIKSISYSSLYTKHVVSIQHADVDVCSLCASRRVSTPPLLCDTIFSPSYSSTNDDKEHLCNVS